MEVKIEKKGNYHGIDKYNVLTSHNGRQWSGGGLMTLKDIEKLRDELDGWLTNGDKTNE